MKFAGIKFEEFRIHLATSGLALIGMLTLLCLVAGCGGGAAQPPPPAVSVAISPTALTVDQSGTQTFTATVTGTTNAAVTWSVQEGAAGGTITSAGVYTAPQAAGTFQVIATSQADTTKTATATVTVPAVAVAVSPTAATVFVGEMANFTFTAMVTGTINAAVTWAVQEGAAGGTITSAGVYTAPQTIGTFHVIATSQADGTKSATATITVPPVSVAISPSSDTLGPRGMRSFRATVTESNAGVTCSIVEGAAGGSVTTSVTTCTYQPPATTGTFHVKATSIADPAMAAVATVTIVPSGFGLGASDNATDLQGDEGGQTATLLENGTVLFAGGVTTTSCGDLGDCNVDVTSAAIYDPAAGTFTATGSMNTGRADHTATLLQDGRVLVTGGEAAGGSNSKTLDSAEIFDPATGAFTFTGVMQNAREGHTATLLPNGKVLLAGGLIVNVTNGVPAPVFLASTELFDPATGKFTATGSMATQRGFHTATLLQNGKVLMAGGSSGTDVGGGPLALASAEIYDPASATFTSAGDMATARQEHTATLLQDGRVLIAGGRGTDGSDVFASTELFDPSSGTFSSGGSMVDARSQHTATLLPNGDVLIAGGGDDGRVVLASELFDPATGSFTLTGSLVLARAGHTATLLNDGTVLVFGGAGDADPSEIYK